MGVASCNIAGFRAFNLDANTFNQLAADGSVSFRIVPNSNFPLPIQPTDGTNPCNPGIVDSNGDIDSVSYAFVSISYPTLTPTYFATGTTGDSAKQYADALFCTNAYLYGRGNNG